MDDPGHLALGTWSGGRFMHFGEPLDDARLEALLRPDAAIPAVITADTYGTGEADRVLGRALAGTTRDDVWIAGAVGHDFYEGEREGAKGFPRFTDARLRGPEAWADYLRAAAERSLERIGIDRFDLLMLHNPDRSGYHDPRVWEGMAALKAAGLTDAIGVAPGPANGFTLDLLACLERFGELLDWAMVILNPMEPWPGEYVLPAAAAADVKVITRVVDYGGIFWDDVRPGHPFRDFDHRKFRPEGWIDRGVERLEEMRAIADRHGLTPIQLASQWNLAHPAVEMVVPTLIQEAGPDARPVEDKRAELAATPREVVLSAEEILALRTIGDNAGCMALKGANPDQAEVLTDRWPVDEDLAAAGERWGVVAERDLRHLHA
ncbi:aldo/keto reductase [Conexibacter sp. W3-3-2]|uniref:aldo/keto reductase n=1 Tax=Conexibacter sp. W3-3-2 TaxID=2675227 RepID=UPI0012B80286|nr:aldo/keto reductase [Conexibacter sp. W3-3-2]MTD46468.1 aldo/keto reductase [Conexibacter sp. W3-3-2]